MFTFSPERVTSTVNTSSTARDPDAVRLLVAPNGIVQHAGKVISKTLGANQAFFQGKNVNDIFVFESLGEADFDAGQMDSGIGNIIVKQNQSCHSIYIDPVQTDGGTALILCLLAFVDEGPRGHASILKFLNKVEPAKKPHTMKQASQNLSDKDWAHFGELTESIMLVISKSGEIDRANTTFQAQFGPVSSLFDCLTSHQMGMVKSAFFQFVGHADGPRRITQEWGFVTADGLEKLYAVTLKRYRQSIYLYGTDISDREENQSLLKEKAEKLSEAQTLAGIGHWTWQLGQDDIELSPILKSLFGYGQREDPTVETLIPLISRRDIGRMQHMIQRATLEHVGCQFDFKLTRPDGEMRFVHCRAECIEDQDGEVVALKGIMQDITERIETQNSLRAAKAAAEKAYNSKSQFLANMSHELRTPLNAIIGFSEIVETQMFGPIGTEKYLEYVTNIRESGQHLLELINDILDMSKIEAGKYQIDTEELNIVKTIRLAIHMVEARAMDANIKIVVLAEDETLQIMADRRAVMQIMLNLLSNAVKFSHNGSTIEVHCVLREDKKIQITVADQGVGIPKHRIAHVMKPFEQADQSYTKEYEGTGLGLAISKELVEQHKGSLTLTSEEGVGTTVTVILPVGM